MKNLPKRKVLIVDTNEINLVLFTSFIRKNYDVITVNSIHDALKIIETNPNIGLIITPVVMEGYSFLGGFDLILQMLKKTIFIPVILLDSIGLETIGIINNEKSQLIKAILTIPVRKDKLERYVDKFFLK